MPLLASIALNLSPCSPFQAVILITIIKTGVEEGRAELAQARENERDPEMYDTQSDGVKKRMDSLSTAVLSMRGPFMSGKDRSALKMQPWEVSVLHPVMVVSPGRSLMLQRSFSQP